jgi:ribosomal peptide maturation radical SAM protein 1
MTAATTDYGRDVLLAYMPLGVIQLPSLGLSLLKGGLERRGVRCDVRYFNLELLGRFFPGGGRERGRTYVSVIERYQLAFAGEALFAERRFGTDPARREYIDTVTSAASAAERGWIEHLDSVLDGFLDYCLASVDWNRYRVVGFSSVFLGMTVPSALLAKRLKERYPHVRTVLGGPNTEGDMGVALAEHFPEFDYILRGEADETFPTLVDCLLADKPIGSIPGLVHRDAATNRIVAHDAQRVANLDALAYPMFDEFLAAVASTPMAARYADYLELPFESSRGCWWGEASHCKFCGINALGMNFRAKSADRLCAELDHLVQRYQPALLAASDAILDREYFKTVLPAIAGRGYGARISYEIKANIKRPEMATLAAAGVSEILPGIETFSTRILKLVGKGATIFDNILCLRLAEEYGLKVRWYHMCGLPGEQLDDYVADVATIDRIAHLQPPREIARFTLQRFTPYFNNAAGNGIDGVRALAEYRAVFPFEQDTLNRLAYHFEFAFADGRDEELTASVEELLQSAVARWQDRYGCARLDLVDHAGGVMIVDARSDRPVVFVLDHYASIIYRLLDRPFTAALLARSPELDGSECQVDPLAALLGRSTIDPSVMEAARQEAAALGGDVVTLDIPLLGITMDKTREIAMLLARLDRAGLVIAENDRFLALAVPRTRSGPLRVARGAHRRLSYTEAANGALQLLGRRLLDSRYLELASEVTGDAPAHDVRRVIRRRRNMHRPAHVDAREWACISVFLLGQTVRESVLRAVAGECVGQWIELGLITTDPPWVRCDRYAIVPVDGRLFVTSRLAGDASAPESVAVYVGLDTMELIDYTRIVPHASLLDLGCGGGLVGISRLLDDPSCRVTGVDVVDEAIEAARVNAAIHAVPYDVRVGDLYHAVPGERFELILADPPALALPDDMAFPVYGTGGRDGDDLLRRIIAGAPSHLTPGGRLIAVTELQCRAGVIPLLDWAREWLAGSEGRQLRVEVRGARYLHSAYHRSLAGGLAYLPGGRHARSQDDVAGRLAAFARERRLCVGYWVHVHLQMASGPSEMVVDWQIDRATRDDTPRCVDDRRGLEERVRALYGEPIAQLDELALAMLTRLNGINTLAEIAGQVAESAGGSTRDTGAVLAYVTDVATAWYQAGLIELEPQRLGEPR